MKRVLLTGGSGFIGSHMLEHLLTNTDWEVVIIAGWTHRGIPERILDSVHYQNNKPRVTVITHDLVAPLGRMTIERIGRIDYIIHAAAESHVDRSITHPVPFFKNNVDITLNLLEYARVVQPEAFIQISTDETYGASTPGHPHREWDPVLPSNPYSGSKAAQEAAAICYWRTYGVPVVITNTVNNFGERQDPEKFIPMIIKRVLSGETVTIHGREGDIGSRFYIHARNHADAVLYILKNLPPVKFQDGVDRPDRYNITGDVEVNNLDMASMIATILDKPLKYELQDFHLQRPGHDRRYDLSGEKLKGLGWVAPVPFEESLKSYVQWTVANPEWLK
jgi:dTDP-glucose 4,6-dehydratase